MVSATGWYLDAHDMTNRFASPATSNYRPIVFSRLVGLRTVSISSSRPALALLAGFAIIVACAMLAGCAPRAVTVAPSAPVRDVQTDLHQHLSDARARLADVAAGLALPPAQIDIPAMQTGVARADDSLVNAERVAVKLESSAVVLDAQAAQIADLERQIADATMAGVRRTLNMLAIFGAVVLAGGCALLMVPVPTIRGWAGVAIVFGGVLAGVGFFGGPVISGFAASAPWLVYVIIGVLCAVVLAVGAIVVIRMVRVERSVGVAAQDKLIAKGDIAGAAVAAFAAAGAGDAGWTAAKVIELAHPAAPAAPIEGK